jgi:prepilin peptidase CpaA
MPVQSYLEVALVLLVTCAAINDLATRRIPNRLLLAAWLVALPLHLLAAAPGAALSGCALGALTGLLLFLPLYLLGGTAAGDVKLMATIGAFVGPELAFSIAMMSWCAGGILGLLIVLKNGRLRDALANMRALLRPLLMGANGVDGGTPHFSKPSVGTMPYGVAIAFGTLVVLAGR